MKQKNRKLRIVMSLVLTAMILIVGLMVFGLSRTVEEISESVISETPEAVLASAGVNSDTGVTLAVAYYDQRADECVNLYEVSLRNELSQRQFEWAKCGYERQEIEQGMVDFELGEDYLPVAVGGKLTSNQGLVDLGRWFKAVDGKSKSYAGELTLNYKADGMEFSYYSDNFYPLDEVDFSEGDFANEDGHNHLFTMSFAIPIRVLASGEERFKVMADDDTFVFVGDRLAIDLGGIHETAKGEIWINEQGKVYVAIGEQDLGFAGINVEAGENTMIRIFHADRDARSSEFGIDFTGVEPMVTSTQLAGESGVQVAYDPNDPSYVAPLGVSLNINPDMKKEYMIIATVYGVMIVVAAVMIVILARSILRVKK